MPGHRTGLKKEVWGRVWRVVGKNQFYTSEVIHPWEEYTRTEVGNQEEHFWRAVLVCYESILTLPWWRWTRGGLSFPLCTTGQGPQENHFQSTGLENCSLGGIVLWTLTLSKWEGDSLAGRFDGGLRLPTQCCFWSCVRVAPGRKPWRWRLLQCWRKCQQPVGNLDSFTLWGEWHRKVPKDGEWGSLSQWLSAPYTHESS